MDDYDKIIDFIQPEKEMTGDDYRLLDNFLRECNDGEDAMCHLETKAISDEAAKNLTKWRPNCNCSASLYLGVESLSDKAAKALSLWRGASHGSGELCLTELNEISVKGAKFLLENPVHLRVNLNKLSESIRAIIKQRVVADDFGDGEVSLKPIEK